MRRHAQAFAFAAAAACSSRAGGRTVRVAAAADLARAFGELGPAFATATGITPRFEFGSSGLLAKQIEAGAPFFLFAAANRGYVDQVVRAGRCDGASVASYARGELVIWTAAGIAAPAGGLAGLADPRFRRIAIANPEHAPYGVAAKQALAAGGVWDAVAARVVLGENVEATLQFATTGNADAAIVARSLTMGDGLAGGTATPIDPALHAPIDQSLVVCGTGDEADAARALAAYIASPDGRALMQRYGFALGADATSSGARP